MKRFCKFIALVTAIAILFGGSGIRSQAAFNDLKKSGCSFNFYKGSWVKFSTKLPGQKSFANLYGKITKYSIGEYPNPFGSNSSTSGTESLVTVSMTIQVQNPKKPSKKVAKNMIKTGHDFIDFVDVVVVDKGTGENLNTSETSEDGTNYHGVSVSETEWKGLKPQKLVWSDGTVYQYYVSYVKTIVVKFPSSYKKTCVGICGTHISDYDKMVDWNEGFTQGYTVFSDSTHVKLGSKKKTAQLSHFINIKKKKDKGYTSPFWR